MIKNRTNGLALFIIILAFMMLACGLGSSSEPTQAPPTAEPTSAPVIPTDIPAEPTEVPEPTAVPTEVPAEEPTEAPPAEPVEPPPENIIYIEAVNGYRDSSGSLHIVGLVSNNTDRVVDNIEVEIKILDENDNSLFTEVTSVSLYTVAPGETTPFSYWVFEDLPDADNYVAKSIGGPMKST